MHIEKAVSTDYENVLGLFKELDDFHADIDPARVQRHEGVARTKEEFLRYVEGEDAVLFFCIVDDEIVAFANAIFIEVKKDRFKVGRKYVLLDNLYVNMKHRRKGIGMTLYQRIRDWAFSSGTSNIEIQVFWGNEEAKAFYKKIGFKSLSIRIESNA